MIISLLYLHYLGEAVDMADIPAMLVVAHVEGRRVARSSNVATRGGEGTAQSHSLRACHPDGAPVLLEEIAAKVTKLVFVRLIAKDNKRIVSLCVGEEEDQVQELAVDSARGRHARRQESHVPVAAICVTIVADLVGSCALEDAIWVVGVAELALILPYLSSADEIVAQGGVHQQIGLLRHADVADFEVGAVVALTSEHPLGGENSVERERERELQMRSNARKTRSCAQVQLQA
jgi:hypothetical protein